MKILSLFANIGVSEASLSTCQCEVVLANEIDVRRAQLHSQIYPDAEMICGDFTEPATFNKILERAKQKGVDAIIATPPCQGMSTASISNNDDNRNYLIVPTLKLINQLKPKYVLMENVSKFLKTELTLQHKSITIENLLKEELSQKYHIRTNLINLDDYEIPQSRKRMIVLLTRKDQSYIWKMPPPSDNKISLKETIGHLPDLDPMVKDVSTEEHLQMFPNYNSKSQDY